LQRTMDARDDETDTLAALKPPSTKPRDSRGYWSAVATQLAVVLSLLGTQQLCGRKVVFQVDRP
jgi:hypothetical protein